MSGGKGMNEWENKTSGVEGGRVGGGREML